MRRWLTGVAFVLVVGTGGFLLGTSTVWSQSTTATGNSYLGLSYVSQAMYILGFKDGGYVGAVIASDPASTDNIIKCLEHSLSGAQLKAVLEKNLADHPETRNRHLVVLTMEALTSICRNAPGVNMTP